MCTGTPQMWEGQRQGGKMRYICYPELRNGIGAWGFQGQDGHTQDEREKRRC